MGLDITAYSKLEFAKEFPNYDSAEEAFPWDGATVRFTYGAWAYDGFDRIAPLAKPEGDKVVVYVCKGEELKFRAGSYGGYSYWRNWLARVANGLDAQDVWNTRNLQRTRDLPFYELIDFSDCEGVIGTDAAKELAIDFAAFQDKVDALTGEDNEYNQTKYAQWRKACELAADGGAINFH